MTATAPLQALMQAIAAGDTEAPRTLLAAMPELATARIAGGATRAEARAWFLSPIGHYIYEGDTALHVAAAGYRVELARWLIGAGAGVSARNRRGAEPLHYAADGNPNAPRWTPADQAAVITLLIQAGADPNAADKSGVAPLHRAVRTRSAPAVAALLAGGADRKLPNRSGSTPLKLAQQTTGRGGSGSPAAKAQQAEILRLLGA